MLCYPQQDTTHVIWSEAQITSKCGRLMRGVGSFTPLCTWCRKDAFSMCFLVFSMFLSPLTFTSMGYLTVPFWESKKNANGTWNFLPVQLNKIMGFNMRNCTLVYEGLCSGQFGWILTTWVFLSFNMHPKHCERAFLLSALTRMLLPQPRIESATLCSAAQCYSHQTTGQMANAVTAKQH